MEHEESIVAYAPVPGYGWGVIVQQPAHSSMGLAARDTQLRRLLTGYSLILLLGVMTAILILHIAGTRQREESDRLMKIELERQVAERTSELQAANRELQSFSYAVSHDLRSPLRSIDGFSKAIIEDYAGQLDDQGRDYLDRVRAATQRMGHLIDDMLALSRVTLAEMRRETVDLSALAAEVIAELQKNEPERKVDWRIEPGLTAKGDAHLLRVLLFNLLGNAWKFTGKTENPMIEFGAMRNAPILTLRARVNSSCATTAPVSTWPTPANCSAPSGACTPPPSSPAPGSDWPRCSASCIGTAGKSAAQA